MKHKIQKADNWPHFIKTNKLNPKPNQNKNNNKTTNQPKTRKQNKTKPKNQNLGIAGLNLSLITCGNKTAPYFAE